MELLYFLPITTLYLAGWAFAGYDIKETEDMKDITGFTSLWVSIHFWFNIALIVYFTITCTVKGINYYF